MPADWSTLPAELQLNIYGHLLNTVGNPGAREKILKTRLLCCQIKREFEHEYLKRIPQRIAKSLRKIVNRFTPYRLIKPRTFIDCLYLDIRLPVSWARALCRAMCVFHQRRRAWMTEVQKVVCHDVRSIRLHIDHTRDSVDPRAVQPYQHWYDIDPVVMGLLNPGFYLDWWSVEYLCRCLLYHPQEAGTGTGIAEEPKSRGAQWVIYWGRRRENLPITVENSDYYWTKMGTFLCGSKYEWIREGNELMLRRWSAWRFWKRPSSSVDIVFAKLDSLRS
jgi:hypothetical protein